MKNYEALGRYVDFKQKGEEEYENRREVAGKIQKLLAPHLEHFSSGKHYRCETEQIEKLVTKLKESEEKMLDCFREANSAAKECGEHKIEIIRYEFY